ncbi:hypothetical protein AGMMS50267_13980 [Spirochaetia bacterium]|nr:hypothetical protein AGMMS50267_13980 [Spirochaetia bacterium]
MFVRNPQPPIESHRAYWIMTEVIYLPLSGDEKIETGRIYDYIRYIYFVATWGQPESGVLE